VPHHARGGPSTRAAERRDRATRIAQHDDTVGTLAQLLRISREQRRYRGGGSADVDVTEPLWASPRAIAC